MRTYNYIKILLIFLLIFPAGFTSYSQEKPEKEKPEKKEKTYSDIINEKTETDDKREAEKQPWFVMKFLKEVKFKLVTRR